MREFALELFLHAAGREDPELIEIQATAMIRELLVGRGPEDLIWIEEIDEPVELDITLEQAGIDHRHHVHRGRCRQAEVAVRFNTRRAERPFSPGTTIKTVYRWASGPDGFHLTPEQAAKHVLAVPGADHFLDNGVHIGSLVPEDSCQVILDLLPRDRFAG